MNEAAKDEAVKKAPESKASPKKAPKETVVYVGPDRPGIADRYAVYNNGLPEELQEYIRDNPEFRQLVVPVSRLAHVNAELGREGSAMDVLYRKACRK